MSRRAFDGVLPVFAVGALFVAAGGGPRAAGAHVIDAPIRTASASAESIRAMGARSIAGADSSSPHAAPCLCSPPGASFARAVDGLTGVQAVSPNDRLSRVAIRGLSGERVAVVDGGLPMLAIPEVDLDGVASDPALARRIDWLRGPPSLRYSSDPLTGVLRLEPFAPPRDDEATRIGGELEASNGDEAGGGRLQVAGARGPLAWVVTGAGRHSGDLHYPGGGTLSARSNLGSGDASVRYRLAGGGLGVRIVNDVGRIDEGSSSGPTPLHRRLDDTRVQLAGAVPLSGTGFELNAQWQHRRLNADDGIGSGEATPRFDAYSAELAGRHTIGGVRGTAGVVGLAQRAEDSGSQPLPPGAHVVAGAAFAIAETRLGDVDVSAGARSDVRHVETDESLALGLPNDQRGFRNWTGSLEAAWDAAPGLTISLEGTRSWRPPTIAELYSRGRVPGTDRYEIGGRGLDAEHGFGAEAGARYEAGPVLCSIHGYWRRIDSYVALEPTAPGSNTYRYVSRDAGFTGGEATAAAHVSDRLSIDGRIDYVSGQDRTTDRPLSSIPPPRWGVGLGWRPDPAGGRRTTGFRAEVEGHGRSTRLGALDRATDPFVLVNLIAERQWTSDGVSLVAAATVRNVANETHTYYLVPGSILARGEGRSIELRISGMR